MARTSSRKRPTVDYSEEKGAKATEASRSTTAPATAKAQKPPSKAASKTAPSAKDRAATKRQVEPASSESDSGEAPSRVAKRPRTQAKAKAKGDASMPLAPRTAVASLGKAMYIGAHVSAAGGVNNSIGNAMQIGANSFALFLKSQRKWNNPPIGAEARDLFIDGCKDHGYSTGQHALPHGSYLVNLAQSDATKAAQAYASFVDDLQRCEQLGIRLYNFHPGSTLGDARPAAIARIAAQLNRSHGETKAVVTVLENMAGSGNVIGSTWEDLRDIIDLVDDKDRVGVCIDTCHAFAAGYDLRTPETFKSAMEAFDKTVGHKYLKAFHLNDSKAPLGSNRDLHANIGTGFLGLGAFHSIVNDDAFVGMPMVLETPIDAKGADGKPTEDKQIWADEIKLLESLIGMDPQGDEFKALEAQLQARGAAERARIQAQVDKKSAKDVKKSSRGGGGTKGGRRKKADAHDDTEEESS